MRLTLSMCLGLFALALVAGAPVFADDIHLCPYSPDTCSSSNVIPIANTTTTAYVFGAKPAGDLFLAELVPASGTSGNWNSGTLWNALGESPSQTFPTLASAISQEFIGTGMTVASFNVSDISEGAWTTNGQSVTLPSSPAGTIFMGFTEDDGALTLVTPWSSSLVNTGTSHSVPEPSSGMLSLLGVISLAGLSVVRKFMA
jgi:hypothetical protein